jgi:hypothetical protein
MKNFNYSKYVFDNKSLQSLSDHVDHTKLAVKYSDSKYKIWSVIVTMARLKDELWNNLEYNIVTNNIAISQIEEEARDYMGNRYMSIQEVHDHLIKCEVAMTAGNNTTDEQNRKHVCDLEDKVFDAQLKSVYPEIIENYRRGFSYDYNEETDEEIPKDPAIVEEEWPKELLRLLTPRTYVSCKRNYDNMPAPLSYWDSRHSWQQYYFILDTDTNILYYAIGGYASSGSREAHGRYGHTFAVLNTNAKDTPTLIYHYDDENKFNFVREYANFKVVQGHLTGNYQPEEKRDNLMFYFQGRLLQYEYETFALEEQTIEKGYY